ncbi:hypothetical protein CSKR_100551 [Clonorchis sinensis]|uniref:Uncharacterized protein n=1 Tax=Clonorchis sinensis TaxID=79923 RepID=A0A3R7EXJ3_CLOSI|nr:hypothetical protein CSKR_100551 [Clonorchis sinensis]
MPVHYHLYKKNKLLHMFQGGRDGPSGWSANLLTERLGQPGSIPALVQPSGGMAVRHRKGATAERFIFFICPKPENPETVGKSLQLSHEYLQHVLIGHGGTQTLTPR